MPRPDRKIVHVTDTALMVAACRAFETEHPDGFVRDPFAARLAGSRGMEILRALDRADVMCFGIGVRSRFIDELIRNAVESKSVDTVVSIGCGLDARPYRLALPPALRWIEVDFPEMLDYKSAILAPETPSCDLRRIPADLTDAVQRQAIWDMARSAVPLMITEGLLMYLPGTAVQALASEGRDAGVRYWLADVTSPAFARVAGLDTFRDVQNVRADGSFDGLQILAAIYERGWVSVERRSYLKDIFAIGGNRLREFAEARAKSGTPAPPPVSPDDPTGIHLFASA